MSLSFIALQRSLGVKPDGAVGRATLSALFKRLGAHPAVADELALAANVHLRTYGILTTPQRFAHFIAQVAHESGGFKYMEEIASGAAYEGRKDLGNVNKGDGVMYKGRGPIQITGRANYRTYGQALGIDLERHPHIASTPSIGLLIGCKYWADKDLNPLADADDIKTITRKINGGLNGFDDRCKRFETIKGMMLA